MGGIFIAVATTVSYQGQVPKGFSGAEVVGGRVLKRGQEKLPIKQKASFVLNPS